MNDQNTTSSEDLSGLLSKILDGTLDPHDEAQLESLTPSQDIFIAEAMMGSFIEEGEARAAARQKRIAPLFAEGAVSVDDDGIVHIHIGDDGDHGDDGDDGDHGDEFDLDGWLDVNYNEGGEMFTGISPNQLQAFLDQLAAKNWPMDKEASIWLMA